MSTSRRVIIACLFTALILLTGWFFWPFVLNEVLKPIATVAWLLLRIFVLSIDQHVFWAAIIFAGLFFLYRLLSKSQMPLPAEEFPESNETINTIGSWRTRFFLNNQNIGDDKSLKRDLAYLLSSLYASKQHSSTNYKIYDALEKGQIPLPEQIHTFLFPEKPREPEQPLKRLLQSICRAPRKWIRRWTGQETAEIYQMIDEVLKYMETSLESKNDL
jgi:hypothetical protein